jgi:hypothetical protein
MPLITSEPESDHAVVAPRHGDAHRALANLERRAAHHVDDEPSCGSALRLRAPQASKDSVDRHLLLPEVHAVVSDREGDLAPARALVGLVEKHSYAIRSKSSGARSSRYCSIQPRMKSAKSLKRQRPPRSAAGSGARRRSAMSASVGGRMVPSRWTWRSVFGSVRRSRFLMCRHVTSYCAR